MADYDAIVVGGGHNGLVAAFYLARAGRRVCVLERRPFVGGACATEELFPGYLVSSCSYIVWNLQEKVVVDMDLARHGFVRTPVDPLPVLPLRGNEYLAFWADEERTKAEVARVNARDAERYSDWLHFWYRAAGLVHPFFLREPPTSAELRAHARAIGEEALLDKLLAASIADIAAEYLTDPRVAAAQVLICDVGDPYAPGSAWSEAWWHTNEHNGSVPSVVRGGMGAITRAMASAVAEQGGEIRTDAAVERILVENGRATGVRLSGRAGAHVGRDPLQRGSKADLLRLLGPEDLPATFRAQIDQISTRAAYLKFHAILDRPLGPQRLHRGGLRPSLLHLRHHRPRRLRHLPPSLAAGPARRGRNGAGMPHPGAHGLRRQFDQCRRRGCLHLGHVRPRPTHRRHLGPPPGAHCTSAH